MILSTVVASDARLRDWRGEPGKEQQREELVSRCLLLLLDGLACCSAHDGEDVDDDIGGTYTTYDDVQRPTGKADIEEIGHHLPAIAIVHAGRAAKARSMGDQSHIPVGARLRHHGHIAHGAQSGGRHGDTVEGDPSDGEGATSCLQRKFLGSVDQARTVRPNDRMHTWASRDLPEQWLVRVVVHGSNPTKAAGRSGGDEPHERCR